MLVRSSSDSLSAALGQVTLGLLQTLAGRFSLLCHLTGQHAASLTANLRRRRDVKSLLILDHTGVFLDSYHECVFMSLFICTFLFHGDVCWKHFKLLSSSPLRYCGAVGNFQVMGGFQSLTKPSLWVHKHNSSKPHVFRVSDS